jgi:hypothetical protein
MKEFEQLGELVEHRWRAENYSEKLFPQIAAEVLIECDLPAKVDPWDIIRWVHRATTLPEQQDVEGKFGNPPITLFSGSRFYVDVYYWLDGTTSIHQHSFTGAFQVLLGSSIHSHYSFDEKRIINEHFSIGDLKLEDVQLLQKNDVRKIQPGRQFIHSLFHLDRPSATITVRTQHTPSAAVQYDYRKPHFALNPFFRNVALTKKMQTVGLLLGMKHKDADAMIGDLISSSDFHTAYFVLQEVFHLLRINQMDELFGLSSGKDRFQALLDKCRKTHGEVTDLIMPVLEEQRRQLDIVNRRGTITTDEHRFFLALLLNISSREKILELVQQRYPATDPVEKVLDWVEELSRTRVLGSREPNALGIEGFDDQYVVVLECLLKGNSKEQMRKRVDTGEFQSFPQLPEQLDVVVNELTASTVFKTILG